MAITCEDFKIDVAKTQSFKYLQAKQFDHNSRKRRLIITDSNIPIKYSDDRSEYITLSLYINGRNYSNTSCPFESDGYPYITFTESMLSEVGDVSCEIRIYDHQNGSVITTFTFMMTVSYLIPVIGVLCTLYGRSRSWYIGNAVLAILMFLFNLFHLVELFTGFSAVQLPLLPVILVVSGFLCMESCRLIKR